MNLGLNAIVRADIELMRTWRNNPLVWKYCRQNDYISDLQQESWFQWQSSEASVRMWMLKDGEFRIGVAGLTSIDMINRRAEISIYLAPEEQGKGFGLPCCHLVIDHGFKNLGLHVIWGECFDENPAFDMFLKSGFKPEGVRRDFYFRDGKFINANLFSLKAEEWLCGNSQQASQPESSSTGLEQLKATLPKIKAAGLAEYCKERLEREDV